MANRWVLATLRNGSLALLSVGIGLTVCEAALRLLHPRYALAANPPGDNPGNTYHLTRHPDTGVAHRIIYNNLGGRQSRNFLAADLDGAVNIAFFGDSQTENVFMPAQYSFTEPLDFLLNVAKPSKDRHKRPVSAPREPRFNVLNFGRGASGPARAYVRWRDLAVRRKLAHVFYMLVSNDQPDLRRALRSGSVRLAESGEVRGNVPLGTSAWKRLVAGFHVTYLALDAWQRLADGPVDDSDPTGAPDEGREFSNEEALRVFSILLRQWKREVEADGGVFHLVLLPNPAAGWGWASAARWLSRLREEPALRAEVGFFDLRECFEVHVSGFAYRDWSFANDPHWNPAANLLAARCLFRYLEDARHLPEREGILANEALAGALHAYYQAFLVSSAWEGQRYTPDAAWARSRPEANLVAADGDVIVAKYLALELAQTPDPAWLLDAYKAGPVATDEWDAYVDVPGRRLVYVEKPCAANWRPRGRGAGFFLHAVPFTPEKLPSDRVPFGFVNRDDAWFTFLRRSDAECVFWVRLPDYPLSRVTTGQYATLGTPAQGEDPAYEQFWSAAFQMPLARSVWEVRAGAHGRGLTYVKSPCGPSDTEGRFFLHVHPTRPADLPEASAGRGYVNLDFAWDRAGGVVADGGCRITAALPDFPIAFVRTGQFRGGVVTRRLWSVRIEFAEPSAGAARKRAEREGEPLVEKQPPPSGDGV